MKIYREIDGKTIEIELTVKEVREAYLEEQTTLDRDNVEDYLKMYDFDEDSREEFEELYGLVYDQVSANKELLMRMGKEMRVNLDDRGMDWDRAREIAVKTVLKEYKAELNGEALKNNLAKLPERCFGVSKYSGRLIIIVRGEEGYRDAGLFSTDSKERNEQLADEHNAEMGVTKAQAAAMLAGSMFGWHVPAADVDNYDKNGQLLSVKAKVIKDNCAKLPSNCYSVLPGAADIIIINRGESGYYNTDISVKDREEALELVAEMNEKCGISKAQEEAMLAGSMFGWHVPGADVDNYDENGKFISDDERKNRLDTVIAEAKNEFDRSKVGSPVFDHKDKQAPRNGR